MKLYNRKTSYYTIITIPKCLISQYGKKQIWRSLNTKDYKLAINSVPRGFELLSHEKVNKILEISRADESFIVN